MAVLDNTNFCKAGIVKGSAWNTEADVSSGGIYLYMNSIKVSGGFDDYRPEDVGQSGKRLGQKRLNGKFDVTIVCDTTASQGWLALLAGFLGTESTPAEVTTGQGDYLRTMDLADAASIYWTVAWKVETDKTRALPSVKIKSFEWACDANGNGKITFQGIADTFLESSTNTHTKINALSAAAYESLMFGGSAAYFRYGAYSTSSALSSSNNLPIMNTKISLTRDIQGQWGLRGASSGFTLEPLQLGDIDGSVMFKLTRLDRTVADLMADWASAPFKMAEIFLNGTAIGTGTNRSLLMQFPYLQAPGAVPSGQDVPGKNQFLSPELMLTMLKAPAAPAGMTGVTDYLRVSSTDLRATKWTA